MLNKMFIQNPDDPVSLTKFTIVTILTRLILQIEFMQQYLRDNHGRRPAVNVNLRMELDFLRTQVAKLSAEGGAGQESSTTGDEAGNASDESSEDSEGDDDVLEMPLD